jgi:hypothetical protein
MYYGVPQEERLPLPLSTDVAPSIVLHPVDAHPQHDRTPEHASAQPLQQHHGGQEQQSRQEDYPTEPHQQQGDRSQAQDIPVVVKSQEPMPHHEQGGGFQAPPMQWDATR